MKRIVLAITLLYFLYGGRLSCPLSEQQKKVIKPNNHSKL